MLIKCKMCGGDLAFEEGSTVCECEYCGSRQTIPNADNEKKTNLFNRANRLRMNSEFDKASAVYEQLVAEFPEEAEAYWGLCLCNYGIEYVDDPTAGKKLPTCHRTLTASIMEDANFEQACDYADSIARKVYRDEAKAIDRIQKDILSIAANEAPYDVFICYKETAEDGGRTEDSVLAQDIYDALTAKGMKVFFSRITLEDKLGVQYEPYIFAALSSAKVMLAIGTAFEYYDAVWVKNEWSRFLSMMKTDKTKTLIPCFKGLDAYDMPKEFKNLQAQDMGKLGWMQDLVRGVMKLCGKGEAGTTTAPVVQQVVVQQVMNADGLTVDNAIIRAREALSEWRWKDAANYAEKALDMDPRCARAVMVKLCVEWKLTEEEKIKELEFDPSEDELFCKVVSLAVGEEKARYSGYAETVRKRLSDLEKNKREKYPRWKAAMEQAERYRKALAGKFERQYDNFAVVMEDGTVYASSYRDAWDVSSWTGIDTLACNGDILAGLKVDGTVVVTGHTVQQPNGTYPFTYVYDASTWTDIVSIAANSDGLYGVTSSGQVVWTGEYKFTKDATPKDKQTYKSRIKFYQALESFCLPSAAVISRDKGLLHDDIRFLTTNGDLYLPGFGRIAQHVKQCRETRFIRDDGTEASWHVISKNENDTIIVNEDKLERKCVSFSGGYVIMDGGDVVSGARVLAEDVLWVGQYDSSMIFGNHSDGSFFACSNQNMSDVKQVDWAQDWTDIVSVFHDFRSLVGVKRDGTLVCVGDEKKILNVSGIRLFQDIDAFIENSDARRRQLLNQELAQKKSELANLKGFFTGKRRKELEAKIEALTSKLR